MTTTGQGVIMTATTTAIAPGDLFVYTGRYVLGSNVREVLSVHGEEITCAVMCNDDATREVDWLFPEDFASDRWVYVGTVRPSSDRLLHIEDGDLFVYTYEGRGSGHGSGNAFVLEISHAYVPGDPDGVRGFVHMPSAFVDLEVIAPLRFERAHLRDFQYCGKIDNGTRDGRVVASEKPTTQDADAPADQATDETAE